MNAKAVIRRAEHLLGVDPLDLVATFSNWKLRKTKARRYSYVSDIPPSIDDYPWGSFQSKIVYNLTRIQTLDEHLREKAKILQIKTQDEKRREEYKRRIQVHSRKAHELA